MKKNYSFTLALFLITTAFCSNSIAQNAQSYINQEAFDRSGNVMLLGRTSLSGLNRSPYKDWFEKGQADYEPDSNIIKQLKPFAKDLSFKIYAATWCGDTRRELPRFVKVLAQLGVRPSSYELYMVDNHAETYKQAPENTIYGESIFRVATFIIEKDGKEIGRIIESPVESLEKDLLNIVLEKSYEPTYHLVPRLQNLVSQEGSFYVIESVEKIADEVQDYKTTTGEINAFGYVLLGQQKNELAIAVLKINTLLFPDKSSVYDSLGEAFMINKNIKQAIECFEKVVKLEPENSYAKEMLEKLRNQ